MASLFSDVKHQGGPIGNSRWDGSSLAAAACYMILEAVNDACDTGSLCFEYSNQGLTIQYVIIPYSKKGGRAGLGTSLQGSCLALPTTHLI